MFFHVFFVDVEGRRAKIIICHQNKIVLHEQIFEKPNVYADFKHICLVFGNKMATKNQ